MSGSAGAPGPLGVAGLLRAVETGPPRRTVSETREAMSRGALVIDTRTETQRAEQGELPGAIVIDRTVLEWRLDPCSGTAIAEATDYGIEVIVVCAEGYSSRLAAASLRALGLHRATDLVGGFAEWRARGGGTTRGGADVRR